MERSPQTHPIATPGAIRHNEAQTKSAGCARGAVLERRLVVDTQPTHRATVLVGGRVAASPARDVVLVGLRQHVAALVLGEVRRNIDLGLQYGACRRRRVAVQVSCSLVPAVYYIANTDVH